MNVHPTGEPVGSSQPASGWNGAWGSKWSIPIRVVDPASGTTVEATATTDHALSSFGVPVLTLAGKPLDWDRAALAEPVPLVIARAYGAGLRAGRREVRT